MAVRPATTPRFILRLGLIFPESAGIEVAGEETGASWFMGATGVGVSSVGVETKGEVLVGIGAGEGVSLCSGKGGITSSVIGGEIVWPWLFLAGSSMDLD